jgi:hypothetical protein
MLADALFQIGIALVRAQFLGEVVIELGQGALFDSLHFHVVGHGFASKIGLAVVCRIDDLGLQFLARLCAAQC